MKIDNKIKKFICLKNSAKFLNIFVYVLFVCSQYKCTDLTGKDFFDWSVLSSVLLNLLSSGISPMKATMLSRTDLMTLVKC